MIGLLGTNTKAWRFRQLESILSSESISFQSLNPYLFIMGFDGDRVSFRYGDSSSFPRFDVIYVVCLGFDKLPEVLYKLDLLRGLESTGIRIVNPVETIKMCRNKVSVSLELARSGVNVPRTLVTESVNLAVNFIESHKPIVLKPISGTLGKGLVRISSEATRGEIIDKVAWFQANFGRDAIYAQEFVEHPHYDIRVLVVGGRVVSKMRRHNPKSWKTNISSGATPLPSVDDVDEIALKAAEVVGGDILGVDILPSVDGEFFVLEVNGCPGWRGLQEVTPFNIAETIIQHLQPI